jgi:hypothetical protein
MYRPRVLTAGVLLCYRFTHLQGGAKAYNTVPVNGWLWWAYNENSGDTGGIVMNQWQEFNWEKINWMVARLGLRPWYMR